METRRWTNHSLPQTLQNAVMLLYLDAALGLLFEGKLGLLLVGPRVAAGYGIANEQKWGYQLGVAAAFAPAALRFAFFGIDGILGIGVLSLLFEVALIVLLLHPMSKDHQRIWFR